MSITLQELEPLGHNQLLEKLTDIRDEADKLSGFKSRTKAQEARLAELLDDAEVVHERMREVQREGALANIRKIANGESAGRLDSGDGARFDDVPRSNGVRDQARRVLDSLRSVPDDGRQRLTRSFERAEAANDGGTELDTLSKWLLATGSPAYARAVAKLFRDPENGHREFTADELAAYQRAKVVQRAMAIGTDSAGGFMLPTHLDPQILLSNVGAIDPIRQLARTETIATDTWNGVSSAGVTASWDAEAAQVSDDSPTLAQPSVPTHKGAAFVAASIEAAMDTSIGDQVSALFVDAKMRLEADAFLTGNGTGQPTGVTNGLGAGQLLDTAAADVLASADVTKPAVALPPRWQPGAAYIANNATAIAIGAFETTGGSLRYPEINATPSTLLRKPFFEHSGMDAAGDSAAADNDNVLLLGDWRQYLVVDRVGATVEFIPHLFQQTTAGSGFGRPTGQRGWYLFWRTGGDRLIDDAFRLLRA